MLIYYRDVLPAKVSVRSNYRAYVLNVLAKDHYIFWLCALLTVTLPKQQCEFKRLSQNSFFSL